MLNINLVPNEETFGLTGVDHTQHRTSNKRMKEHNSAKLQKSTELNNRSMYDRSPFGLSIGRIDEK